MLQENNIGPKIGQLYANLDAKSRLHCFWNRVMMYTVHKVDGS